MAVSLKKGQRVDINKDQPQLTRLLVGLGWDINRYGFGAAFDLDASAFLLGANGKVTQDSDFIFYGHLEHHSGCLKHMGDNRTGMGEGDDEVIEVDLNAVPADIQRLVFTVTIYDADERRQNFGQVDNSYIRVVDETTNTELLRYDLGEDYSIETALVVGELYRHQGYWKFNAVGSGVTGGLEALCAKFGIETA